MSVRKKPHVHPVDDAWLARGAEQPVSPAIEIVDSHIHLWDFSTPPYFTRSYEQDARSAAIASSIYVDCTMGYREDGPDHLASVGEVEFALKQAKLAEGDVNVAAAIVGWADLCLGDDVDPVLEALEAAGGGRFRGIRTRATYDADPVAGYGDAGVGPGMLLRDDYRRGVERLAARGHVLDLYAFHTQLAEVADLAKAFPDLPIVLNHIGGPLGVGRYASMAEKVFDDWKSGIATVATCPNVFVKIGGFAISRIGIVKVDGLNRPPSSSELAECCAPWVQHCFEEFSLDRCLFGSNFPVDKVAFPLLTLVNAMKLLTGEKTLGQQEAFFAGNAKSIYKL